MRQAMAGQDGGAWRVPVNQVDEWMADELDGHAGPLVQCLLEREDHEHAVREALDDLHPARSPGPQLRPDVIHDRNAPCVKRLAKPEVEVGEVDGDEHVRALALRFCNQVPVHAPRARQPRAEWFARAARPGRSCWGATRTSSWSMRSGSRCRKPRKHPKQR